MKKLYPILAFAWLLIGLPGCKKEQVVMPTAEVSSRARVTNDVQLATDTTGNYYNVLGVTAALEGQYDLALQYHQQAITARINAGIQHKIAKSHNNIAIVYRLKGDFVNASIHYEQALAFIRTQENEQEWQAHIRRNYALAYQDHGDYEKARKMYRRALSYWQSVGNQKQIAMLEIDLRIITRLLASSREIARFSSGPIQGGDTHER
jgi:tetratricopeptide (TPR) repeat protein